MPVHLCRTSLPSKRNSFFSTEFNGFPAPFYAQPERGIQTRAKMLCRDCCRPEHQRAGLTLLIVAAQPQWKSSTLGWSWYGPTMQMLSAPRNTPSSGTAGSASLGGAQTCRASYHGAMSYITSENGASSLKSPKQLKSSITGELGLCRDRTGEPNPSSYGGGVN